MLDIDEYMKRNGISHAMLGDALGSRYPAQNIFNWRRKMPKAVEVHLREMEASGYWQRADVLEAERARLAARKELNRRLIMAAREHLTPEVRRQAAEATNRKRWARFREKMKAEKQEKKVDK